jgi:sarcosine oxidase subunit alpha
MKAKNMTLKRITKHPILQIPERKEVTFSWNGKKLIGYAGEMISSALFANGIHIFGHHPKDNSPQGIFCANGQCSQCMVIVDGMPVKACMTPLAEAMIIQSVEGLPQLPENDVEPRIPSVATKEVDVLIIGAGPAGLAAAVELGKLGVETLIIDDKDRPGGKLVLQTHKFFGSVEDSYAGTRGFEIATILAEEINTLESVEIWLNTTAVGVFSDKIIGAVKGVKNSLYKQIKPKKLLIATGARE